VSELGTAGRRLHIAEPRVQSHRQSSTGAGFDSLLPVIPQVPHSHLSSGADTIASIWGRNTKGLALTTLVQIKKFDLHADVIRLKAVCGVWAPRLSIVSWYDYCFRLSLRVVCLEVSCSRQVLNCPTCRTLGVAASMCNVDQTGHVCFKVELKCNWT
jgi:hypothetical protein